MEIHIAAETEEAGVVQAHDAIDAAALHGGDARLLVIKIDELEAVDARRPAPIIRIGAQDGAVAGDHFFKHKGTGAIELHADVLSAGLENDELVVRQVVEKVRIRLAQANGDGVLARSFD